MLYLLESDTRNVKWNGIPLHEATSAIIKEQMNGDFILTVRYPITDSEIYQLFREDMLIKAPAPVIGPQLFRIKKPVENDDHLEITAYHITDDVMQRSINPLSVNKQSCWQALSQLVQVAKSPINDFSFTSDITDRRTINTKEVETLYSVLMDGAHSIVGTWEGELVRDNFSISIKRNRGEDRGVIISTHKNLKSYQRTKNSQNVVTRIHAKSTFKAEGAKEDTTIAITVDSPLIGAYPYINERSYTNNNIQTVEELTKWASAKFTNEHIDKATDAIKIEAYELDGQTVHLGDTVNLKSYKHNVDVYKKAIAYEYDCLANNGQGAYLTITFDDKVKSGGNGGGVSAVANAILDKQETQFDIMLERALANADRAFDTEFAKREKAITDGIELARARAEEVKQELSDTINQRFNSFDNGPLQEVKRRSEEALRNAGASSLLAQEAKRIGLDSVAKLEEFKRQATSAQTAFSGDLDVLKRTIANDIRPKQAQAEAEIAKQVEALVQTKKELSGVKSAQATYEETTTRRLSELTNLANSKASKSELTQTAEELASKIASVEVGGRNYYRDSEKIRTSTRFFSFPLHPYLSQENVGETWTLSFDIKINEGGEIRPLHFYHYQTNRFGLKASADITPSKDWQRFTFTGPVIFPNDDPRYSRGEMALYDYGGNNNYSVRRIKLEKGDVATDWSPALEDIEGQISAVESNFRQRADALEAGVRSLTEGLRTKADISALNVTAENIRQSVKSLETDTQNKLDQKLSQAEFEVRAGSIRQEILNATKDKADKTLVTAEAGKLREEFSNLRVGGRNYYRDSEKVRTSTRFFSFPLHLYLTQENVGETWTLSFDIKINQGGEIRPLHFYHYQTNRFGLKASADITPSKDWQRFTFTGPVIFPNDDPRYSRGEMALYDYAGNNNYSVRRIKLEKGTLATDWSPAIEDTDGLITEAKAIFERTAQGLRTDLSAIQEYVNKDGQRQEALQRYSREESAKQATAVRELVAKDYVGKATYQETVKAIEHKFEAITNPQNGSIATQIATYKTAVDGRFADISSLLSRKTNQSDFQRVKETSQLYERILGNTENGIADKVARMALTNQLFQVEVAKAAKGGRNYIRNGQFKNGSKNWLEFQSVNFGLNFNYQHSLANRNRPGLHFYHDSQDVAYFFGIQQSFAFDGVRGEKVSVSLLVSKDGGANSNLKIGLHYIKNKNIIGQEWQNIPSPQITSKYKRFTFTFTLSDDVENLNLMLYGEKGKVFNLYVTDVQLERGSVATDYKEAPEDTEEAIRTVQTQLAGSWAVQNINSAGDIISGINLGANGQNRITGKLTHITGDTLIDNAVIKSAMVDKLKTANFEAGSVTTTILDSEAVTAEKLKVDFALVKKLTANDAFIEQLTSKRIFSTKVESVISRSTVLEGYKGWIGGFQLGTHDSGYGRWLTGRNHFSVGMGDGEGGSGQTALWVNWGSNWSEPGYYAWFVKNNGKMYCYNTAEFWKTPIIHGDLKVTGRIRYDGGVWIYSGEYEKIGRSSKDYFYLEKASGARDWFPAWNDTSDRRLKSNIQESDVSGIDIINRLKTYSYRKEFNNEVEDISCGIMAQDVQKYAPDAFREGPDGIYTYNTFALVPYLIKAIQELNQKIEKMEKTIA